ncbi:WD40 repeat-like protein [Periconia macrospinosa]|uniref:WD40 repeat-like protein n=1 Tax=Periconia macrospinosa TaxID=97972 RepID=A0A2V1D077_9PLEO|nr:WD40 repeat-like protein [Periconia macrospinosa]
MALSDCLQAHTGPIFHLAFSPNSKYLASSADDSTVRIWDMEKGKLISAYHQFEHQIFEQIAFSRDGKKLMGVSCVDRTLFVWNVRTGEFLHSHAQLSHPDRIKDFQLSNTLIKSRLSDSVLFWEVESGNQLPPVKTSSPTSQHVIGQIAIGEPAQVRIWALDHAENIRVIAHENDSDEVDSMLLSPDSQVVAYATRHFYKLFDLRNARWIRLSDHIRELYSPSCMAFSPDSKLFAAATDVYRFTICFWDVETGHLKHTLTHIGMSIGQILFSPDGKCFVFTTESDIKVYRIGT